MIELHEGLDAEEGRAAEIAEARYRAEAPYRWVAYQIREMLQINLEVS